LVSLLFVVCLESLELVLMYYYVSKALSEVNKVLTETVERSLWDIIRTRCIMRGTTYPTLGVRATDEGMGPGAREGPFALQAH
jgi:hypothetical protein